MLDEILECLTGIKRYAVIAKTFPDTCGNFPCYLRRVAAAGWPDTRARTGSQRGSQAQVRPGKVRFPC
jgi:hypothetical protein